jgi:glyoxylase-like metal-dependent hydrolase (beta-lactamase superfamily II)
MKHYIESLQKCRDLQCDALAPGHGEVIDNPTRAIDWIIDHRLEREEKVRAAIEANPDLTTHELVPHVYQDVDKKLYALAERSLLAHVLKLEADGVAIDTEGRWRVS